MNTEFIKSKISEEILRAYLKTSDLSYASDQEHNIVAIDIGYGYTKYSAGFDDSGVMKCNLFPSVVAISPQENFSGGFFVERNTVKIEHGGTVWECGEDIFDIASKSDVRALHENFIHSEQWKILFYGALMYAGTTEIDMLVLGLPVSNMRKDAEMAKMAQGTHVINGVSYNVKSVKVVPQPLGAMYNHAINCNDFARFSQTNTLIIDPGFLTFDFLVTKGFSVNAHRSGARPGGMSSILNAISTSVSRELDIDYDDANEIDKALDLKNYDGPKDARPVYIYGKEINLTDHIRATKPVIDTSLNFMQNKIGDSKDIFQIIMGGGPNIIFASSIQKQFPKHNVVTIDDGIFGNVKGFMYIGMMQSYLVAVQAKEVSAATA
jgi:plasmid segregation protein ParM